MRHLKTICKVVNTLLWTISDSQIREMAYKLDLRSSSKMPPIFHVNSLEKNFPNGLEPIAFNSL